MVEPVRPGQPWLHGPVPDLLFGCGALFAISSLILGLGSGTVFRAVPAAVPAMLVAFVSAPHYGATLLRVYDRRSDRRAHFAFSVVATAVIAGIFGLSLFHHWTGSALATVYLTWTGWHYTAQNFGIAMMYARRRGHSLAPRLRRSLHASFVLSFALVVLVMHGQQAPVADPSLEVRLIPLAIPAGLGAIAVVVVLAAYLGATGHALLLLVRGSGRLADGLPIAAIVATQALWWSVPYAARHFDLFGGVVPFGADLRSAFFVWIAVAHAAQYLWITSHFARSEAGFRGFGNYYGRALLAGSAIWMLPALAFAPATDAFDWNFALLLAAAVNVHHFVLDGAVWKLRQSRVARALIEDRADVEADERSGGWIRGAVWSAAAFALLLSVASLVDRFYVLPSALKEGRLAAAARSLDRQAWFGTTDSITRFQLGRRFEAAGDLESASIQYERSARNVPRIEPYRRLLAIYERTERAGEFGRTCDALFALESDRARPAVSAGGGSVRGSLPDDDEGREASCMRIAQGVRGPRAAAPPAAIATNAGGGGSVGPLVRYD
ncbi:MAG: hypothetical protein R3F21_03885 [Myxococcota bacterium]